MVTHIETHLRESLSADALAERAGYSVNQFRRKFFAVTGETPSAYVRRRRLTEAAKQILAGRRVVDVSLEYGYSSQDNFTTAFRSWFGLTPSALAAIDEKYRRFITRMREVYTIMDVSGLTQTPLATSLMGCVEGAARFFDLEYSTPALFGLTGHAFVINIHDELCPSGPYVWKTDRFYALLSSLGIASTGEYAVTRETPAQERRRIEEQVRNRLDAGELCIVGFLEYQLIGGYDESGFTLLRPWNGQAPSEIATISFSTWEPCLETEGWAYLTTLAKRPASAEPAAAVRNALAFALDLRRTPADFAFPKYHLGDDAYRAWIAAVGAGHGSQHGHWWNATVWAECRRMAAAFFGELSDRLDGADGARLCGELQEAYGAIASALEAVSNRELPADEQIRLLAQAREHEDAAEGLVTDLLQAVP